jgi:hypothetical protein
MSNPYHNAPRGADQRFGKAVAEAYERRNGKVYNRHVKNSNDDTPVAFHRTDRMKILRMLSRIHPKGQSPKPNQITAKAIKAFIEDEIK